MKQPESSSKAFLSGAKAAKPPQLTPQETLEITGLCVNCDKKDHCLHCPQPGGVWFCEEYE